MENPKKSSLKMYLYHTELSHVVQERAEGPKAPSPGIALGNVGKNKIALFYSN